MVSLVVSQQTGISGCVSGIKEMSRVTVWFGFVFVLFFVFGQIMEYERGKKLKKKKG